MGLPRISSNCCSNNMDAAAEIFEDYGDFIRGVIRYQVRNNDQVDDLFQDFFLSLVAKPIPSSVQDIKSYLYRAITNDIIDVCRKVERYQAKVQRYSEQRGCFINKSSPENALIEEEQTDKMFELMKGRLSPREAQAISLRYKSNYNIKEVAVRMNVNDRTVSRYISVGLSRIRHFLMKKQGGKNDSS